jgi:hypothetical protein
MTHGLYRSLNGNLPNVGITDGDDTGRRVSAAPRAMYRGYSHPD